MVSRVDAAVQPMKSNGSRGRRGARGHVGPIGLTGSTGPTGATGKDFVERRDVSRTHVQRGEFSEFAGEMRGHLLRQDSALERQGATLGRLESAMFARDADNEFQSIGVMTVMQKVDKHLDVLCNIAKWTKRTMAWAAGTLTALAGLLAAGRAAGWW